jgi:AhpD family alkylhydroperoxidase
MNRRELLRDVGIATAAASLVSSAQAQAPPRLLVSLVYLRVSQINGCAYCIDMHSRDLIKEGLAVEKLVLVQVWREAGSLCLPLFPRR